MSGPAEITVWVCDQCGYWRREKSGGVHQTNNPDNWRGAMVKHELREAIYVPLPAAVPSREEEK